MSLLASTPAATSVRQPDWKRVAFSPELELLLVSSALVKSEGSSRDLRSQLEASIDWPQALRLAEQHGVMPLLYQALRDLPDLVPHTILEELRVRYEHNARKNLRFTAELIRILDCLESHDIAAIPFKGPVLAEAVYGDLALREFSDLDILVRPTDFLRAKDALRELGFAPSSQLSAAEERACLEAGYERAFDGPAGRNLLEIQWRILPRFYAVDFNLDGFFARVSHANIGGRTVKTLCPEDLLLALCVHAAKHAWIRLCWLRDIAAVAQSQPLKWDRVLKEARELGMERILGISLLLANRLLGAGVPDSSAEKWRDHAGIEQLCDQIAPHLPNSEKYSAESLNYFRLMFRLRERASDRLRFALRLVLTPGVGEWSVVRLPAALFPLYRVIRLFRLAGRVLRSGTHR